MAKERTKGLYKVATEKINGIWFRGQYLEAFKQFKEGEVITISSFRNGSWESTKEIQRFMDLLNQAKIEYSRVGTSFRSMMILDPTFKE